jgi:hypothetical protein
MKPNTIAFENKSREIIAKNFKGCVEILGANVKKSVYLPENDRGQWAPTSLLVVNHENGIPGPHDYELDMHAEWEKVSDELSVVLGRPVFFEAINQAVSALYWA